MYQITVWFQAVLKSAGDEQAPNARGHDPTLRVCSKPSSIQHAPFNASKWIVSNKCAAAPSCRSSLQGGVFEARPSSSRNQTPFLHLRNL